MYKRQEERIQRYERYWGVRFPDDYREFLKTYNGAEPVEKSFEAIGHLFALTRFFCVLEDYKERDEGWYLSLIHIFCPGWRPSP